MLFLFREDNGEQFSIVFDCRGAGLKNMDMEFTQFMINTMKEYYPDPLNYILVFEMPWVLNAAFKIIKVRKYNRVVQRLAMKFVVISHFFNQLSQFGLTFINFRS